MKDTIRTLCIPMGDSVFFGDIREGKFLNYALIPGGPDQVFHEAAQMGFRRKHLVMAALFPDFRQITFNFPDMREEDLPEAIYWDRDRLFRTEEPIVMDWRILLHDSSGYKILAVCCKEEKLRLWQEAAKKVGWTISRILSVPEIAAVPGKPVLILLCGKREAAAYRWDGKDWQNTSRILLGDEDQLNLLKKSITGADLLWFPLTTCGNSEWEAWQKFLSTGEESSNPKKMAFLLSHLMEGREGMNLALPEDRPGPFWSKELQWLRAAQGITVLCAAAFLTSGLWYGSTLDARQKEQKKAEDLAPVMEEMTRQKKEEKHIEAVRQEVRHFTEKDPAWLGRLVVLADAVPPGIVLRRVETAGKDLVFTGTARDSAALSLYQQRLRSAWKIQGRTEVRRTTLPYYEFSLRFSLEDPLK